MWVETHSRRVDPINLSAKALCQGDAGSIGSPQVRQRSTLLTNCLPGRPVRVISAGEYSGKNELLLKIYDFLDEAPSPPVVTNTRLRQSRCVAFLHSKDLFVLGADLCVHTQIRG